MWLKLKKKVLHTFFFKSVFVHRNKLFRFMYRNVEIREMFSVYVKVFFVAKYLVFIIFIYFNVYGKQNFYDSFSLFIILFYLFY